MNRESLLSGVNDFLRFERVEILSVDRDVGACLAPLAKDEA